MILEDFTMLGTTVPEPSKDGRIFVCSAGVSLSQGLVRIYPLARRNIPHRWDTYQVPVERNNKDSRVESWKVEGLRDPGHHEAINRYFHQVGVLGRSSRPKTLSPYVVGSIAEANERRISLAILHPLTLELYFKANPPAEESPQEGLFELDQYKARLLGSKRFAYTPRLKFQDEAGAHDLQLRDWGCFEFMRKKGYDYAMANMANSLYLDRAPSLFIGNMNHFRNNWLVISVLQGLR